MVIFDALPRRKMIVNEAGPNTLDLVGTDRCPDAATTNRHAAIDCSRYHRLRKRDDDVGIVVIGHQSMRTEIHDLMTRFVELDEQFLFQTKPTVIGSDPYAHKWSLISFNNH